MNEDVVSHMRDRRAKCRLLAKSANDERTRKVLLEMAEQIDEDLKRLGKEG